jgi:hypothetical protein
MVLADIREDTFPGQLVKLAEGKDEGRSVSVEGAAL